MLLQMIAKSKSEYCAIGEKIRKHVGSAGTEDLAFELHVFRQTIYDLFRRLGPDSPNGVCVFGVWEPPDDFFPPIGLIRDGSSDNIKTLSSEAEALRLAAIAALRL